LKIFEFEGKEYRPGKGTFKTDRSGLERLQKAGRLEAYGETLAYRRFAADFPYRPMSNLWTDTLTGGFAEERYYVVQTIVKVIQRCLLMTTDPGDLVVDLTCGSGTTAFVAEQWGRRWITCDTSRVALTLAKQRLMTAVYDYYELAHPHEGVGSGFKYKTVPHITLRSITNNEPTEQEVLYDQPFVDNSRTRITGPFTVEAVPAPVVKPLVDIKSDQPADESIARSGETLRQAEWRDELLKSGIRGKKGQYILFSRVEPLPATRWLHAEAETKPNEKGADRIKDPEGIYGKPQRVVISFGPEHAPLEQKQVELAIEEAQTLVPKPKIIVFAAFQFDPEAAKDIDETDWPGVTLLKVQMNADLLTEDLKKKRVSNESFWLIGQPDIVLKKIKDGDHKGKYRVEVMGFDYYNTKTGTIESGGNEKIAIWMLDADYDGRSLLPRQVFFPMAGENDGWARLARNLKAEIDEELIEKYRGTVSLPFEPGKHKRAAVKIVDDRGIESLKLLDLPA
jgi:adenine-specific DNA-methyltransferase